jgi:hypothetical protein
MTVRVRAHRRRSPRRARFAGGVNGLTFKESLRLRCLETKRDNLPDGDPERVLIESQIRELEQLRAWRKR